MIKHICLEIEWDKFALTSKLYSVMIQVETSSVRSSMIAYEITTHVLDVYINYFKTLFQFGFIFQHSNLCFGTQNSQFNENKCHFTFHFIYYSNLSL